MLNYPQNITYKESRVERNLLPLEYRRKISDLVFFFKSKVGLVRINGFKKVFAYFKLRYGSRNYDPNNCNLIYVHNQDYYRKSYFIRTTELWNSLPSEIKSLTSLNLFQNSLFILYVSKRSTYNLPG